MFDCGRERNREGHHQAGSWQPRLLNIGPRGPGGHALPPKFCKMHSIPPAALAPIHVLKITDICKDSSLGRHASVFTSLRSLALKIPPPAPPHHGARLCIFPTGRTWGVQYTRPTAFLHVGGQGISDSRASSEGPSGGKQASQGMG